MCGDDNCGAIDQGLVGSCCVGVLSTDYILREKPTEELLRFQSLAEGLQTVPGGWSPWGSWGHIDTWDKWSRVRGRVFWPRADCTTGRNGAASCGTMWYHEQSQSLA